MTIPSEITLPFAGHAAQVFDVRDHGARGDGTTIDSGAINMAIASAAAAGAGAVIVPAGRYLCFSIRLASHVTLVLAKGAVIEAADPAIHPGSYDLPEDNGEQLYQDFGHSHWHNSLIWAEDLEQAAIVGPGMIVGTGLTRDGPGARWKQQTGERPLSMAGMSESEIAELEPEAAAMQGKGNKAIALKRGRDIVLSGFTMAMGGHFAILATGTRKLTISHLAIDTDRDGIDLDCVADVVVEHCRVNSPNDDAIVLKSSLALGRAIPSEDVVIRHCLVSGFDMGTMLDGSFGRTQQCAPDRDRVTGRIKLGTESNGGYRRITIEDCRFERSRGVALETVDGGIMEDVTVRRITMREVTTAPLFAMVGDRRRGPDGTGIGRVRRITFEDIEASGIDHRFPVMLSGLADSPLEDIVLRNILLQYEGGGTAADARRMVPEIRDAYPEPSMLGVLPAWALWARHVCGLRVENFTARTFSDERTDIILDQCEDVVIKDADCRLGGNVAP
ncbi:rhamnogalacturonidase [Croceicoccus mobilis]|uniref:Exo-poly-alpha-D-galacturonosidase n=1 Tax=Croceicoccus mobilis TaxID=1703339 RepID=A0A916ZA82_9SPHN|nr:glycosyl hydrolase family 28-related protein [Croceicoccus mobilis]GGD82543.1 exo-poly-alpha-D-galacturonosidase [Croceicoccus mobilis]